LRFILILSSHLYLSSKWYVLFRYCIQNSEIISSIRTCSPSFSLVDIPKSCSYSMYVPFQYSDLDIYCRYRLIHETSTSMWHCFVAGLFKFPKYLNKTLHTALYHAVSASTWPVAPFFSPNNELSRPQTFCTARCDCFSKVLGIRADPCCR
jgi:hypothetical protein